MGPNVLPITQTYLGFSVSSLLWDDENKEDKVKKTVVKIKASAYKGSGDVEEKKSPISNLTPIYVI